MKSAVCWEDQCGKNMKKKLSLFNIINTTIMSLLCLSIVYPFLNTFAKSLSSDFSITMGLVTLYPVEFRLSNYQKIIFSRSFYYALRNTVIIVIIGTSFSLSIVLAAGYALSRKILGCKWLFLIILFTMFFSGGMIPLYLQVRSLKLYNTLWALILPGSFSVYNMILARNFFLQLPDGVLESGAIDGCNELMLFAKIAIPMSKPIIASLTLMTMVGYWNIFMPGILYLDQARLYPLQVYVRQVVFSANAALDTSVIDAATLDEIFLSSYEGIKSAVLILATLPIACVYPFLQKYFVKGLNMGAIKG